MIRINLLPPQHQKVEHTPLPRLLTIFAGVALVTALAAYLIFLVAKALPDAREHKDQIAEELAETKERAKEFDELKAEKDRILLHKDTIEKLRKMRLPFTEKIDQLLSLLPDNIWFTDVELTPEKPPKSSKDDPVPASLVFVCKTVSNPYDNISAFRKNLQGQAAQGVDPDRREKIMDWAKDVKLPLPAITGYDRVSLGSIEGFEWTQVVHFNLRGEYDKKKKR